MNDTKQFLSIAKAERDNFVRFPKTGLTTEQRVMIEDVLIIYDQMMERLGVAAEREEETRKMRAAQKAFFKSPQGSAAKIAALENSRRLERWVDAALEAKPTAATLFE